jgi:lactate dehydrogenase (NAD+,ferredoxin) subunit LctD
MSSDSKIEFKYKYKPIDEADLKYFSSVCGSDHVILKENINEDYTRDEMTPVELRKYPEVLLDVSTTEQVSKILAYCNKNLIAITPRGQGTGLSGGCVPLYDGVLLDMSKMNKILGIDNENLTLTVEPGALIMEIRAFAEENGLFYAPMPGEQSATIGGNISTNAGGIKAVKYGVTREWVRGLEVVLPDGEILNLEGDLAKISSGYSIKNLIIGSEGTLGVVTKAWLKLIPLPKKDLSLLVPFKDVSTAIEAVPKIINDSQILPTSLEFMEREVILDAEEYLGKKFPDNSSDAYLLITLDGNDLASIEKEYDQIAEVCLNLGALDVFISDTPERQETIWSARKAFLEAIKSSTTDMDECDVVVPRNQIDSFIKYTHELRGKYNIRIKSFAHAGDGNVHTYILKDQLSQEDWDQKISVIMDDLYKYAKDLGGNISGEHGIGFLKKQNLHDHYGVNSPEIKIMQMIKKVFDPNNILNPGKIV